MDKNDNSPTKPTPEAGMMSEETMAACRAADAVARKAPRTYDPQAKAGAKASDLIFRTTYQ